MTFKKGDTITIKEDWISCGHFGGAADMEYMDLIDKLVGHYGRKHTVDAITPKSVIIKIDEEYGRIERISIDNELIEGYGEHECQCADSAGECGVPKSYSSDDWPKLKMAVPSDLRRDVFAGQMMASLLSVKSAVADDILAKYAVDAADALIKELDK